MCFGGKIRGPLQLPVLLLACLLQALLLTATAPERANAADASRAAAAIRHLDAGQPDDFVEMMAALITESCAKRELDVDLAVALCFTESNFRVNARNSRTGCAGLFQLAPCHRVADVYNPAVNVDYGLGILADCLKRSNGQLRPALRRYGANAPRTLRIMAALKNNLKDLPPAIVPAQQLALFELAREIATPRGRLSVYMPQAGVLLERNTHTEAMEEY